MADVNDVKSITDLLGQVTEGFKDFFNGLEDTLSKLAGIPSLLNGADNSLNKVTDSANNTNKSLDLTHKTSLNLIGSISKFGEDSVKTFSALSNANYESIDALGDVNKSLTTIVSSVGLLAIGGSTAFSALNDSIKYTSGNIGETFLPILNKAINVLSGGGNSGLAKGIKELAGTAVGAVDSVNNLETSILALHAQTGDLTNILDKTGSTQSNLTKLTDEYTASIARTAEKTGSSVSSVIQYSKEILKIPGLYTSIIQTPLGENLNFTEAAMKLTKGTTQDFGITLDITKQQMLNFAQSGDKPLELLSRMYSVGQSLGIPFSYIQGQIKNVSDQFKFLGDNTQGALTIFESLGEGLQKSKIGPAAISEIVNDVVSSVGQLDIAQKSFLSAQTGGAGGLQGGYQIDQLLSEGKIDEVYKKIETSLKQQFGGKITTLKEGSQDAGSAQQLTKEVAFLTEGPFGKIVKSSEEAYKLLEAFKAGSTTPAKAAPTEKQLQDGLSKSLDVGTAVQQNQYTELQKIANSTEIFKLYALKELGQNAREVARVDLGKVATPTSIEESVKNAPSAGKAEIYSFAEAIKNGQDLFEKFKNSDLLKPTNVEAGLANNNNVTQSPNIENQSNIIQNKQPVQINNQSPDIAAEIERNNILKRQQDDNHTDTVPANFKGDQTIIIKVQQMGPDGKAIEKIAATVSANHIKEAKIADDSAAIVGHQ